MRSRQTISVIIFMLALVVGTIPVSAATRTVTIRVEGMTCEGCARSVERALRETEGVLEARVSFEKGEAWIKYDDQKVTVARLREVINSTGFKAVGEKTAAKKHHRR